jgi:hypothetical protein
MRVLVKPQTHEPERFCGRTGSTSTRVALEDVLVIVDEVNLDAGG